MITREVAIKRYCRTIRGYLPCSRKLKSRILCEIQNSITGYLEEHPEATIEEIETHFGEPKIIAAAYVDDMNTPELLHALRIRRRMITIIFVGIITALLMWGSCLSFAYAQHSARMTGSVEITVEEVTEEMR